MESPIQDTPFVKQLAANDRPTRDKALLSLRTYLSGTRPFTPLDLLKLWKALFYSLWLSDRPIPQQNLCTSISSLLSLLPSPTLFPFLRAFWQTMQREWTNIDVLRMEKFLLLVRRMVGASLERLKSKEWEGECVEEMCGVWEEVPFNVGDMRVPMGLRFHVVDIFVDELERVGALPDADGEDEERDMEESEVPLESLLEPLRKLAKSSPTKALRIKAKQALEDERLPGNKKLEVKGSVETNEDEWGGIED